MAGSSMNTKDLKYDVFLNHQEPDTKDKQFLVPLMKSFMRLASSHS